MGIGSVSAAKVGGWFEFGRKSQDCGGFGVCRFSVDILSFHFEYNMNRGESGNGVAAETSIDESKNTYTLTFSINELKKKDASKIAELDKGKFYLDEDITFPKDANKAYDVKRTAPIVLKAGTYNIKKSGDTATVVIDIK